MKATIAKLMTTDKQARILYMDNTFMMRELIGERPIHPLCAEALAASFTLSSLVCGLLKDGQRLSIRIDTSVPSAYIHCDVDSEGNVRGYASDTFIKQKPVTIPELIGDKGVIRITKDIGMGAMYTSAVDMPHANITDDFSHFFLQSEQVETFFVMIMARTKTVTSLLAAACCFNCCRLQETGCSKSGQVGWMKAGRNSRLRPCQCTHRH